MSGIPVHPVKHRDAAGHGAFACRTTVRPLAEGRFPPAPCGAGRAAQEKEDLMKRPSRPEASSAPTKGSPGPDRVAVEPLLPVAIPYTGARLARGIRAGRWVFASGQAATDYVNGLALDVVQAERPLNGSCATSARRGVSTTT